MPAGVQRELNERYDSALALEKSPSPEQLPTLGVTAWRPLGGEEHLINPQTIYLLQRACREGDYDLFREYSAACHVPGPRGHAARPYGLRADAPAGAAR